MPPLHEDVSESESVGGDIPAKAIEDTEAPDEQVSAELQVNVEESEANEPEVKAAKANEAEVKESQTEEEEGGEEEASENEEGLYEVEAIRSHRFYKSKLLMMVKWKGYPESDNTEETEVMLREGASELLDNYFEEIGGRPETLKLGKRKSSSQLKAHSDSPAPKKSKRTNGSNKEMDERPGKTGSYKPPKENWESEIASIDTIERDPISGKLWVFIFFTNNKRSKVEMEKVYKHCPIAMLKFYERHLSVIFSFLLRDLSECLLCPSSQSFGLCRRRSPLPPPPPPPPPSRGPFLPVWKLTKC